MSNPALYDYGHFIQVNDFWLFARPIVLV